MVMVVGSYAQEATTSPKGRTYLGPNAALKGRSSTFAPAASRREGTFQVERER